MALAHRAGYRQRCAGEDGRSQTAPQHRFQCGTYFGKKGYVGHKAYGKTHEYFPLIDKDAYASSSLSDVLSNYFDGSAQRLVSHLIEDKRLKEKDLEDILKRFSEMND